ncbi:MAG: pyridoxamine 5'-phosphate oxidase [Bacteroidota bacterium]
MLLNLEDLREDYNRDQLTIDQTDASPFVQFQRWFKAAQESTIKEPNAMTLATVGADGRPKARIVLLKQVDSAGFVFYTNYDSQKGQDMAANPFASLVFFWDVLQRQVRVAGRVEKITAEESAAYFQSRPKGSQIGATVSPQSQVILDREGLKTKVAELEAQYAEAEKLPLPNNWGGYRLVPDKVEFWQGRSSRLHDRIRYRLVDGSWERERLAP